jgi:hypothetical protein
MAPDLIELRDAALGLAPAERLELARELQLSVASDEEKTQALRAAIREGDEALDRGESDDVPIAGVRDYFARLVREG